MWLVVAAAAILGQAKGSMLGVEKPWWDRLKPGDVVRVRAPAGYALPLVKMWEQSETTGLCRRSDVYRGVFLEAVAKSKWEEIHKLADRDYLRPLYGEWWFLILRTEIDPTTGLKAADVLYFKTDPGSFPPDVIRKIVPFGVYSLPVADLTIDHRMRHPDLGRLPLLVRRSADVATVPCDAERCSHMEAVSYAEAERLIAARKRGSDEAIRKGNEEVRRRSVMAH